MNIIGLSAFYHDSAAVLVQDGRIVSAVQQERFSRKKHDPSFPEDAVIACLEKGGITPDDVDLIAFYDKPFLKFERLIETYLAFAPRGFRSFSKSFPVWAKEKLFQKDLIESKFKSLCTDGGYGAEILFAEHHQSHAASAFFPSAFSEAAVLTMDGVGEWTTTSIAIGRGNQLDMVKEIHFPHSIGLLYSAFTYYLGFKVNSGEYKVMGLAPYGRPIYRDLIMDHLIDIKDDGSFNLDMSYFDYCTGLRMTNEKFDNLFGGPRRGGETGLTQRDMDLAASIQSVTEEIVLRLTRFIRKETGMKNICLAGGVALNCVANGKVLRDGIFDNVWVQPASGDAGGALGAALDAHYQYLGNPRDANNKTDQMKGSFLGPEFDQSDIEAQLNAAGAKFKVLETSELIEIVAMELSQEKIVGWFQGEMEFGPRALGARSILADPRSSKMQKELNLKTKFRESFRPFAPAVLFEDVSEWFELDSPSPYMAIVSNVAELKRQELTDFEMKKEGLETLEIARSDIPAVTHVDFSARVQTVHKETNQHFHALISKFKEITNCSVLVNTSFNIRGEPIVLTPEDAFMCFMGAGIDILAIGNCLLFKEDQNQNLIVDYQNSFELD